MGWQSIRIVGALACVIFILHHKIRKMANKDMIFGYHPVGTPTCLSKQELRNPAGTQHNLVLGCSLTGRASEVVEALSDKKDDMAGIQET